MSAAAVELPAHGVHCLHCHPSPGCFICCRCKLRSYAMPGASRSMFMTTACRPSFGALWRHYTEGWMLRG